MDRTRADGVPSAFAQRFLVGRPHGGLETDEQDPLDRPLDLQKRSHRPNGDHGSRFDRVAVGTAADRRERDAMETTLRRQLERVAVAGGEHVRLAKGPAVPDRTDRMDDVPRR